MCALYDLKKQKSKMVLDFFKRLFHNKTARKVVWLLVVLWLWYFAFSIWTDCFAAGETTTATATTEERLSSFNDIAAEAMRWLYMLLWPLIFVCGLALDNSLIYWEWFHLDVPLYTIWNIMKNFANFALWFMVVLSIVLNVFSFWKWWGKLKPKDIITKTLIAWVLIQMSWFLPAAIIDVSTILTYSIWWLPMTVLEKNNDYMNMPILWLNTTLSTQEQWSDMDFYYTYWDHVVYQCRTEKIASLWTGSSYIVWPKKLYYSWWVFDTWYCVAWWWVYRYKHVEYQAWSAGWLYPEIDNSWSGSYLQKNKNYEDILDVYLSDSWLDFAWLVNDCVIIPTHDSMIPASCLSGEVRYWPLSLTWNDDFFKWSEWKFAYTINNLLEKSKWMVWPFVTIYSSLLDVPALVSINSTADGVFPVFTEILYKLFFLVILVMPLVALAIVLIVRIWILWVVIAAAPALILIWVFGDKLSWLKDILWKHFKLENIIKLIFAPVIVVFAIWISVIFLTSLSVIWKSQTKTDEVLNSLGVEHTADNNYSFAWWLVELELNIADVNKWKDNIAYFITMIFATGVMRFFLMAAVKMCGETWKERWWKLENWWTDIAKTLPIIPIWWGVWVWTLYDSIEKAPGDYISKMESQSRNNLPDWLKGVKEEEWDNKSSPQNIVTDIIQRIESKEIKSYSDLSRDQQNMLATYYGSWTVAQDVIGNMIKYNTEWDTRTNILNATKENTPEGGSWTTHTSADALMLNESDLNIAVQSDKAWMSWAAGMIWWSVHTQDWVRMVDIIPGTENNPVYEIVTREKYEERHFGKPVQTVKQDEFNEWKESNDATLKKQWTDMTAYLWQMKKQYDDFVRLSWQTKLEWRDETWMNQLKTIFTNDFIKHLSELDPDNFKPQA